MLPAHNGLTLFSILLPLLKRKNTAIYYDVVGGWLPEKLKNDSNLLNRLRKFNSVWVETSSMQTDLQLIGLQNTIVVPNFKFYEDSLCTNENDSWSIDAPLRVCTFSRVMQEKGIEDAIEAVKKTSTLEQIYLDIYGPIDEGYSSRFKNMIAEFPEYICYKGIISPEKCISTLKRYDALLFPTHFYTEGIPGTIVDAYSAGVPIITSLWKNSGDIFEEGVTGWGYEFDDTYGIIRLLEKLVKHRLEFSYMRDAAKKKSDLYSSNAVAQQIADILEKGESYVSKCI